MPSLAQLIIWIVMGLVGGSLAGLIITRERKGLGLVRNMGLGCSGTDAGVPSLHIGTVTVRPTKEILLEVCASRERQRQADDDNSACELGCCLGSRPSCPPKSATRQKRCRRMPPSARRLMQRRASPTCKPQSQEYHHPIKQCFSPSPRPYTSPARCVDTRVTSLPVVPVLA